MIAYDLECPNGHVFEGWFDNSDSFNKQQKKGLISCPVCGETNVSRRLSTFGIARRRHQDGPAADTVTPQEVMDKIHRFVETNFEDVGVDFAKEALKMHYGVSDQRNIRGVSSSQEEDMLKEEGVSFFKLPVRPSPPEEE